MIRFTTIGSLIVVMALQGAATQQSKIVRPVRDNVGVYRHETRSLYEAPYYTVGTADRLQVITTGKRHSKVVDNGARGGWIENRLCTTAPGSKLISFEPAFIEQYNVNQSSVIVFDADGPEETTITLDRSFKDALSENVDRETAARTCER
jgi:hypothetical protein